jgi:FtsZ-binding cell division protein ZapB
MDPVKPAGDLPEKEKYRSGMEDEFRKWGARLDELLGKVDQATGDVKADLQKQVTQLKAKQAQLGEKISSLKTDSGEAWDGLKVGVEAAWNDLKSGINLAWDRVRPKSEDKKADTNEKKDPQ